MPARRLRLLAAVAAATISLSACSDDNFKDPGSARDVAKHAGCSDIRKESVPAGWAKYDEAVTCSLDGVRVAVYWLSTGGEAEDCLNNDPACAEALRAFRP
jgi:hypothetical protein